MKISILLPTRDRLELLRYAVETVRREEDSNWELIVSDNASREDVGGYIASLGDARIRWLRTDGLVEVTDNWNNALAAASGDYVLMLGDDDGVLPGYFATIRRLAERFSAPEVIYHNALLYAYPGVLPEAPDGYLKPYGYATFLRGATAPFVLEPARARSLVVEAMNFRVRYGFNMQFATVSRGAIERLQQQGPFYRSPFPDYYAMNMLFLRARSIVAEPRPCVVIGVSPRSYGFYHATRREDEGKAMLAGAQHETGGPRLEQSLLPGSNINDGWLLAMQAVHESAGENGELRPNLRRYRKLQIASVYEAHYLGDGVPADRLAELRSRMSPLERVAYGGLAHTLGPLTRILPPRGKAAIRDALRRTLRQLPTWNAKPDPQRFSNLLEVYESLRNSAV